MAIKIIKFDLPINGTKVDTLDALRENLTDEIVKLARSGQLERWFKSRQQQELAQAIAQAAATHAEDKSLFMVLCEVFGVEVHQDDVNAIFDQPSENRKSLKNINSDKDNINNLLSNQKEILEELFEIIKFMMKIDEEDEEDEYDDEDEDEDYKRVLDLLKSTLDCKNNGVERILELIKSQQNKYQVLPEETEDALSRFELKYWSKCTRDNLFIIDHMLKKI